MFYTQTILTNLQRLQKLQGPLLQTYQRRCGTSGKGGSALLLFTSFAKGYPTHIKRLITETKSRKLFF